VIAKLGSTPSSPHCRSANTRPDTGHLHHCGTCRMRFVVDADTVAALAERLDFAPPEARSTPMEGTPMNVWRHWNQRAVDSVSAVATSGGTGILPAEAGPGTAAIRRPVIDDVETGAERRQPSGGNPSSGRAARRERTTPSGGTRSRARKSGGSGGTRISGRDSDRAPTQSGGTRKGRRP